MPRLTFPSSILSHGAHPRILPSTTTTTTTTPSFQRHFFASHPRSQKGSQNSRPGWSGRPGDDHAVERDRNDVQGEASQEGMKQFEQEKLKDSDKGKVNSGSDSKAGQGVSRKDEKDSNKRAQEEFPEAPGPVIGMNEERGGVSFPFFLSLVPSCVCEWMDVLTKSRGKTERALSWVVGFVPSCRTRGAAGREVKNGVVLCWQLYRGGGLRYATWTTSCVACVRPSQRREYSGSVNPRAIGARH